MSGSYTPKISKVPFWIADAILVATAGSLVAFGARPLNPWQVAGVTVCAALGGWLAVIPFLREYEAAVQWHETDRLADTTAKLNQLEDVAGRIAAATGEWQGIQSRATQTTTMAQEIADRLARDAEAFATVVTRTSEGEKQTLKLELEKLRKTEGDWVQSTSRLMDHVFALHIGALRSGQAALIDQIERFHGACREALRRVGFVSIVATPDEPFDPRKHSAADGTRPPEGALVNETVGPGYLYQGKLIRPIAVTLLGAGNGSEAVEPPNVGAESTSAGGEHPGSDVEPTGSA